MVEITIPYGIPHGLRQLKLELPSMWDLVMLASTKDLDGVPDPSEAVQRALIEPRSGPKLSEVARPEEKVAILVDDKSRPTPCGVILPVLLEELARCGVAEKDVQIFVGRGLHPSMSKRDLERKVGAGILERFEVTVHDADGALRPLGKTSLGTRVSVNESVALCGLKIGLGTIMPHELAGYTGGAGIILPGVSGRETINQNHRLISRFTPTFGRVEGNLIRRDMEEAAEMAGLDLIINTILNKNDEVVKVVAGDPVQAHRGGVRYSEETFGVKFSGPVDVAISGSHPRDETFGRAMKAIFPADLVTRSRGTIVLVAPCYSGVSYSKEVEEMLMGNLSISSLLSLLNRGELPGESCVLYLFAKVKERKRIIVVSDGLSRETVERMGLEHARTVGEALALAGGGGEVAVLPYGSITLPLLR
jgi:nickel-dependent lactate racemase